MTLGNNLAAVGAGSVVFVGAIWAELIAVPVFWLNVCCAVGVFLVADIVPAVAAVHRCAPGIVAAFVLPWTCIDNITH